MYGYEKTLSRLDYSLMQNPADLNLAFQIWALIRRMGQSWELFSDSLQSFAAHPHLFQRVLIQTGTGVEDDKALWEFSARSGVLPDIPWERVRLSTENRVAVKLLHFLSVSDRQNDVLRLPEQPQSLRQGGNLLASFTYGYTQDHSTSEHHQVRREESFRLNLEDQVILDYLDTPRALPIREVVRSLQGFRVWYANGAEGSPPVFSHPTRYDFNVWKKSSDPVSGCSLGVVTWRGEPLNFLNLERLLGWASQSLRE